ncbi:MAG: YcgN family cysteine cluster protein [Alphaproteobacteria bacterium]
MKEAPPYWRTKRLDQMTRQEWEDLCDGCGKCCLLKVEYEDTREILPTSVACKMLDLTSCRCGDYANRKTHVPDCIDLKDVPFLPAIGWLPKTCAYKLVAERKDLYWWHHLVSGSRETVHQAGMSVRHKAISEADIGDPDEDLPRYVVDWEL